MTTLTFPKFTTPSRFIETMVLLVAVLGTGMFHIDARSVTVALPAIQAAFNASINAMQWLFDIYILILATLLLIGGVLGDRYGHVRVASTGALLFAGGALLSGLAPTLAVLIAARAIQGVGGALLVPSGLALINRSVAPHRRAHTLSLWIMLTTPLIAIGPSLAGWLVDAVSWRAVFLINVPLGLLACFIALRYIPESERLGVDTTLDWPGIVALIAGLGGLLLGLIEGPRLGWSHPLILVALGGGGAGLVAFISIEGRSPNPILPLHLFRRPIFSGITLMHLIFFMAVGGLFFFLALNMQQVQGYSALTTGLSLLPVTLTIFALSTPIGRLTDRLGPKPLLITGPLLGCLSFFLFAQVGLAADYWTSFFPPTLLLGTAMGITIIPGTSVALSALPTPYSGIASGVNHAVARLGDMLAVAVLGALMLVGFQANLAERLNHLPLEAGAQAQLLAQSRHLGALVPPAGLSPELTQATQTAIHLAFIDSFQWVMVVCAGLMLLSVGIVLLWVKNPAEAG